MDCNHKGHFQRGNKIGSLGNESRARERSRIEAEKARLSYLAKIEMVITPWYVDELGNMCRTVYRKR